MTFGDERTQHWPVDTLTLLEEVDLKKMAVHEPSGWGSNAPYKQLEAAKSVTFRRYSSNFREMDIVHPDVKGVLPQDMLWFWRRLGHFVRVDSSGNFGTGAELPVYRLDPNPNPRPINEPSTVAGHVCFGSIV